MLTLAELERYDRQIDIPEISYSGQEKLKLAKVFISGAGGLGSPAAIYLAAAGIGNIKIVDHDRVSPSNLNRQILHGEQDVGRFKVDSAIDRIVILNPSVTIETSTETITADNASKLVSGYDIIIDALDNFETRLILNKAAMSLGIPFIHGAVNGFEGRATTVIPGQSACLRCMHKEGYAPETLKFPVIGVTPAVIGAIQATEAIKFLLRIGDLLLNRLIVYDGLTLCWTAFKLKMNPECDHCGHLQKKEV